MARVGIIYIKSFLMIKVEKSSIRYVSFLKESSFTFSWLVKQSLNETPLVSFVNAPLAAEIFDNFQPCTLHNCFFFTFYANTILDGES